MLRRFITDESGQDLIEYSMLAAFIALVAVVAVQTVGDGVVTTFTNIGNALPLGTTAP